MSDQDVRIYPPRAPKCRTFALKTRCHRQSEVSNKLVQGAKITQLRAKYGDRNVAAMQTTLESEQRETHRERKTADIRTKKGTVVSIRHCLVAGAMGKRYGVNRSAAITVKLPCLRLWP